MKKWIGLALAAALALLPMLAAAGTLRVQGAAALTVAPDTAVVHVGYSGENPDSAVAQETAASAIEAVVQAVTALGILEADVSTAYLNISPTYDYLENTSLLRGYMVEHMLDITVKDIAQVGAVLDAALQAGANQAGGIAYTSSKEADIYLQAMAKAVENAAAKADALAIAAGVWLGTLSEINEGSAAANPYLRSGAAEKAVMEDASTGSSLRTGELTVEAYVELVYETR